MTPAAYIIGAKRTAIGRVGGLHRTRTVDALAAPLIRALLDGADRAGQVDEVILGNAAGGGGNPARLALLAAGLPDIVPGMTVDRQCASGLDAVLTGARLIASGEADVVLAGGAESPSTAPWRVSKPASLYRGQPEFYAEARFVPDSFGDVSMAAAAEAVASECGISRSAQDAYALTSHRRAAEAQAAGVFADEIVPLGHGVAETRDECVHTGLTEALLARLPPLFPPDGTVTAGNTCQISDGAAIVHLVSEEIWAAMGRPYALAVLGGASAGVAPRLLGLGPVPAVAKLMRRFAPLAARDCAIEFNEAFASQVLGSLQRLGIPAEQANPHGGALAFGHPYGASGAVLVTRLFHRLRPATAPSHGLAMLGAAGGQGVAALFHAIHAG